MKSFRPVRNIGILAHVDAGKTTLTERLLFAAGAIRSLGSVDEGTSTTDSLSVERARGISVRAAATGLDWEGVSIRIVDTPGHADFYAEVERSLQVLDGAILVVSAVEGVQLQTLTIWSALREMNIPTLIFVNKLDRTGARPAQLMEEMRRLLSANIVALQTCASVSTKQPSIISARDSVRAKQDVIESLANVDSEVLDRYSRDAEFTWQELDDCIRTHTQAGRAYPVLFGAAMVGVGVQEVLNAVVSYLPAPKGAAENKLSAVVYKIATGGPSGRIAHVRVFEGTIERGHAVQSASTDTAEKVIRVARLSVQGKYESAERLEAGDIGTVAGLQGVKIGDVLGSAYAIPKPPSPLEPMLTARIAPTSPADSNRLFQALRQLEDEDPLLSVEWLDEQKEISTRFFGAVQMEIIREMLASRFNIDVTFSEPRVIYKETPIAIADAHIEYRERGYAIIDVRIEPLPLGSGVEFASEVKAEEIYHKFMKQIPQIVEQSRRKGPRGWEVTDFRFTVFGGHSKYDLGTKPGDFKIVTPLALELALQRSGTRLLEPMMDFVISVPREYGAAIHRDLVKMRAQFSEPTDDEGRLEFRGRVPFAETFTSTATLYASSHGQGVLRTRFGGYAPVEGAYM
ncbi:MAG: TetM/TetW/TetO/TetS family tetracycline resistance ribosomal protection protein [Proteobacteria bacterium]|nr:TetM/TetW/TetO/TetS family tetracycline resistance ribosomal protection protein [Pseudomonadota bacterium]